MTPPTTLQFFETQGHEICVCCGNIRIHYRSVIGGVMTPPYKGVAKLNYGLSFLPGLQLSGFGYIIVV